jgi:hypothetical protein
MYHHIRGQPGFGWRLKTKFHALTFLSFVKEGRIDVVVIFSYLNKNQRTTYTNYHHYSPTLLGGLWATEEGTCDTESPRSHVPGTGEHLLHPLLVPHCVHTRVPLGRRPAPGSATLQQPT